MQKELDEWISSGWKDSETHLPCPPWGEVQRYLARKGIEPSSSRQALLAAQAYTKNWQADKSAKPLKALPLWRKADVAICTGLHGSLEVIKIRLDRAHRLPSGAWIEAHERYPQSERWGTDGFSYTPNSHVHPWAAAFAQSIILSLRARE